VRKEPRYPAAITVPDVTTTDLYEVTMAPSHLREDIRAPAGFSLFVRDLPPGRGFLVAAGLESALDFLAHYRVEREDVDEFAVALHRPVQDLEPLLGLAFEGEVRAVPEGSVMFADEPLPEVTAPLPQAQLRITCSSWRWRPGRGHPPSCGWARSDRSHFTPRAALPSPSRRMSEPPDRHVGKPS
jgi:nicotinate phosphoribosyltransferase